MAICSVHRAAAVVPPVRGGQFRCCQLSSHVARHRAPLSFACSILPGHVWRYGCLSYALLKEKFAYLLGCQISCVVGVHSADGDSVRVAMCQVMLDCAEGIRLVCQEVWCVECRLVVVKVDHVALTAVDVRHAHVVDVVADDVSGCDWYWHVRI
eukprot:4385664-Pleurochrysis_carterae.AAC.3